MTYKVLLLVIKSNPKEKEDEFIQMMIASSDPPFYVELNSATATSTLSVRPAGLQPNNVGIGHAIHIYM